METGGGRAIFLAGPSSAGKTSLGHALIERLPEPFLFYETDRCGLRGPTDRPELVTLERERKVTRGAALAIKGYLDAGLDLVVELGLWHPGARDMAATVFAPYHAWLVGLRWDEDELARRERTRADGRFPGTACAQATPAGDWDLPYDLIVDTLGQPPGAAARDVVAWLATGPAPNAIRALCPVG